MCACITRETFVFTVFRRVFHLILKLELCRQSTCLSTSRSNYIDMSIWKKYADHSTTVRVPSRMELAKMPVFPHNFRKIIGNLLFILK